MLIVFIFISAALFSILWATFRYGIGPVPTSPKVKTCLLECLPTLYSGTVYELGAGWGTLAFPLADHYNALKVIAIEASFFPYLWMRFKNWLFPRKNLQIAWKNFFQQDLTGAKLIVCYLYPKAMKGLEGKIAKECSDALVISHTFSLASRIPDKVVHANDLYHTPVYLYKP